MGSWLVILHILIWAADRCALCILLLAADWCAFSSGKLIFAHSHPDSWLVISAQPYPGSWLVILPALQMKCWWKAYINVWFPFMYSQKWNCYFQNRIIIMFCLPVPTLIYLWEIYIVPGSVCLFCCREICGPILGIYKSLTDTWMWKLGLRPRNSQKRNI